MLCCLAKGNHSFSFRKENICHLGVVYKGKSCTTFCMFYFLIYFLLPLSLRPDITALVGCKTPIYLLFCVCGVWGGGGE